MKFTRLPLGIGTQRLASKLSLISLVIDTFPNGNFSTELIIIFLMLVLSRTDERVQRGRGSRAAWRGVAWCGVVWSGVAWYGVVWRVVCVCVCVDGSSLYGDGVRVCDGDGCALGLWRPDPSIN